MSLSVLSAEQHSGKSQIRISEPFYDTPMNLTNEKLFERHPVKK